MNHLKCINRIIGSVLLSALCYSPATAQCTTLPGNLVANCSCENHDGSNPNGNPNSGLATNWTDGATDPGRLDCADPGFYTIGAAADGVQMFANSFFDFNDADLQQDVDVSALTPLINGNNPFFTFSGSYYGLDNPGEEQVHFELDYLNGANAVIGTFTETIQLNTTGSWLPYSMTTAATANTETIRVRIRCDNDNDSACDGYFDNMGLVHETGLPVELTSFEALVDGEVITLRWNTASEDNNAGFEIQRRAVQTDPTDWEVLGFVEGAGTTTETRNYSFRISPAEPGTYRYRLKQTDFDGGFTFSSEVEVIVELPGGYRLSAPYPNPFNPQTTVSLIVSRTQVVQLDVFDVTGHLVSTLYRGSIQENRTHTFTFHAGVHASGTYLIRVTGENFLATRPVLLLK